MAAAVDGSGEVERRAGYRSASDVQRALIDKPASLLASIAGVDAEGGVRSVYQPIVDLTTEVVVGYEALTRGPAGTPLEAPLELFAKMRAAGQEPAFDRACRDAALARAARAGLAPPLTVFVNVEPGLLTQGPQGSDDDTWLEAPGDLRCVIELTERALASRPAELLHAVSLVRELNWGVALDDVGADPSSLALMAMLRPDVIKLDLRLVQQQPDREVATIVAAVNAQAEETGAAILAEGIETEQHLRTAQALGASLGQGFLFGRPAPLPDTLPDHCDPVRFLGAGLKPAGMTPFEHVLGHQVTRRSELEFVIAMHEHLLDLADGLGPSGVVLTTSGPSDRFAERLATLRGATALLGVVAPDGIDERPDGTPEAALDAEWDVVILAPHFAAAAVARRAGGPDTQSPDYDFAITHHRELVVSCARALVARLATS